MKRNIVVALILSVCAALLSGSCTLERKPAVLRLASNRIEVSSDGGQSRMILYIDYPLHGAGPQCKCSQSKFTVLQETASLGQENMKFTIYDFLRHYFYK